ncbi:MAG: hypothetical protein WB297_08580 [Actinomycetota bacterium]
MDLEALLREHAFMKVEPPPQMWSPRTDDEPFILMLGEMIALGRGRGIELEDLTLNVSNVTVEPDDDEEGPIPEGDYVAITVHGAGTWEDDSWRAGQGPTTTGLLCTVGPAADAAGAVYAYARDLGSEGSVTALLPRLPPA